MIGASAIEEAETEERHQQSAIAPMSEEIKSATVNYSRGCGIMTRNNRKDKKTVKWCRHNKDICTRTTGNLKGLFD